MTKSIQVGGNEDVGQWIIIRPYCEGLVLEVFPKLLSYGPLEGQELELGGMILGLSSFKFSTCKGHWVVMPVVGLLEQYGTQSFSGGISFQPEWLPEIRKYQDRTCHALLLQVLKGLKCFRGQFKFFALQFTGFPLQQVIQGFGYLSIPLYESPEESGHSSESSYFGVSLRRSHLRYHSQVGRTGLHAVGQYLMA